jgi:hypothetical protein
MGKIEEASIEIFNDNLLPLEPMLKKWTELVIQYSKISGGEDACYWYNERANVSVLAAAAWKTGKDEWIALEEYSTIKRSSEEKTSSTSNGRCDLYVANNEKSFAFEMKNAWQNIRSSKSGASYKKASEQFEAAWNDAGSLIKNEADTRLAGCFIVPYWHGKSITIAEEELSKWRDHLKENIKSGADALAWVFPEICKSLTSSNGYIYPGVCLLLKIRQRGV